MVSSVQNNIKPKNIQAPKQNIAQKADQKNDKQIAAVRPEGVQANQQPGKTNGVEGVEGGKKAEKGKKLEQGQQAQANQNQAGIGQNPLDGKGKAEDSQQAAGGESGGGGNAAAAAFAKGKEMGKQGAEVSELKSKFSDNKEELAAASAGYQEAKEGGGSAGGSGGAGGSGESASSGAVDALKDASKAAEGQKGQKSGQGKTQNAAAAKKPKKA